MPQSDRIIELRNAHIDTQAMPPLDVRAGVGLQAIPRQPDESIAVMHLDVAGNDMTAPFSVGIELDMGAITQLIRELQLTLVASQQPPPSHGGMLN